MQAELKAVVRERLSIGGVDACWNWQGARTKQGYGRAFLKGATFYVHRLMYEERHGGIPEDLQIDHLCRNPSCGNPRHMQLVTSRENTLRGFGPTAENARKTHCVNGHEFNEENTRYQGPNRHRYCRVCQRDWAREKYHRNRP